MKKQHLQHPSRLLIALSLALLVCIMAFSGIARAQEPGPTPGTWKINLQDAELSEVIQQVAQITGRSYVLSPTANRRITFASTKPLSRQEVDDLFVKVIVSQNLRIYQDGSVVRIEEKPIKEDLGEYSVHHLRQAKVDNVIPIIEKLIPAEGPGVYAVADRMSNSVILYGKEETRARISNLIKSMDNAHQSQDDAELFYMENGDASKIAPILAELLKGNGEAGKPVPIIKADPSMNAIAVQGTPQSIRQVGMLLRKLDMERSQVLIEAIIVEVSGELAQDMGVQLGAGDAAQNIHQGTVAFNTASGSNMLNLGSVLRALNPGLAPVGSGLNLLLGDRDILTVLIQALAQSQYANLLSTPSIMTMDNEQAKIVVGQNVPFRTGTFTNDNGASNPFTTITREDVGISLTVLPRIHSDGKVKLQVRQEVSSLGASPIAGAADLITNKRTIETSVLAQDGEVIVLGGLMQDDTAENNSKVPVLGDIPIVGRAFSGNSGNYTKRNLLVFLRPTVVRNQDESKFLAKARYDKIKQVSQKIQDAHANGEPGLERKIPPHQWEGVQESSDGMPDTWKLY